MQLPMGKLSAEHFILEGRGLTNKLLFLSLVFIVQSCTLTFVHPYDEKLLDATEAFYKTHSLGIEEARAKSPISRNDVNAANPEENPGHMSHFSVFYAKAKIDANALIIRALVNSGNVDDNAAELHGEINDFIASSLPSNCNNDTALVSDQITLTLQNYLDLKCLVTHWQVQHQKAPHQVLKKVNWESRQVSLMRLIMSMQKAEALKVTAVLN